MKWECEICTYLNKDSIKCEMCNSDKQNDWQKVEKRKRNPAKHNETKNYKKFNNYSRREQKYINPKECWLYKSSSLRNRPDSHNKFDKCEYKKVPIKDNIILGEIIKNINIIGPNLLGHKFYINPDSKYLIEIKDINEKEIVIKQYCLHYDRIMKLTPVSERFVRLKY